MKVDVVMPKMGESLTEGTIQKWLKQPGDKIERDEMILEISTDKVDTEVPSPVEGTLAEILAEENETVEVGNIIARIETSKEQAEKADVEPSDEGGAEQPQQSKKEPEQQSEPAPEPQEAEASVETEEAPGGSSEGAYEVVMPKMGESLTEGTIVNWLKKPGEKVERDEMILEISTDKVDTEVPSPVEGTLLEVLAQEGDTVEVGNIIARIDTGDGAAPQKKAQPSQQASKKEEPAKESQKTAAKAQPEAKQTVKPTNGSTTEIPRKAGDKFFSPVVRNIAQEQKVTLEELQQLQGSGVDGRITKQDVLNYIDQRKEAPPQPKTETAQKPAAERKEPAATEAPVRAAAGEDTEVIPMDRVRSIIAEHMVRSKQTSAHVTSVEEADMTEIWKYRNKIKNDFEKREGFKITFLPFFAKAAIEAIKKFPKVNVSVEGNNILQHNRINLGIATALPDGNLIVPVIKDADSLSLTGLARAMNDLSTKARDKKLNPDDIQGGTFSITNYGSFGTQFGSPIINQPQTAIMGLGAIQKRPVVRELDGQDVIVPRNMVYISLVFDHRVIDGALGGQALHAMVEYLESINEDNIQL